MKRKDIKLLHQKSASELEKELKARNKEFSKLTLERKVKQMKNTRLAQTLKDDIARIATVLKEIQIKEKIQK